MYNKLVITLAVLLLASGVAHAQYYTRSYSAPGSFGYDASGRSTLIGPGSYYNVAYESHFRGPFLGVPQSRSPSAYQVAYSWQPLQPTLQSRPATPSAVSFNFQPNYLQPTYGPGGLDIGSITFRPTYVMPSYGPGIDFGSINLNFQQRQIPHSGKRFSLGPYGYDFRSYAPPIYATPSRALWNTEFHYRSFVGPFWY